MHVWPCSTSEGEIYARTGFGETFFENQQASQGCQTSASSSKTSEIMTQMQQDELAHLFASQLNVSQAQQPVIIEPVAPPPVRHATLPINFASCHYTGTAHIRADAISEPSASPPPPYEEVYISHEMAYVLRQHSIDANALQPTQVRLFQNADYEQKLRLLELWRISPPSYQTPATSWQRYTTMEKEELDAKLRFEQHDRTQPRLTELADHNSSNHLSDAEPYIADGYQWAQTYPSHLEPVYGATPGLWSAHNHNSDHTNSFENQQMHDQIRNHADWERMNEAIARERMMNMNRSMDDEMAL